jgi:signal transduction histidine kinase
MDQMDMSFEASFHREGRRFAAKALLLASLAYGVFFFAAQHTGDSHSDFVNQAARAVAALVSISLCLVFVLLPKYSEKHYVMLASLGVGFTWLITTYVLFSTAERDPNVAGELVPAIFLLVFLSFSYLRLPIKIVGALNAVGVGFAGLILFLVANTADFPESPVNQVLRECAYLALFFVCSLLLARGIEHRERRLFEAQRLLAKEHVETQLRLSEQFCFQRRLKHDIQQPIGALGIAIGLLRAKLKSTPEFSSSIGFVVRCHDAVNEIVEKIVPDADSVGLDQDGRGYCDVAGPIRLISTAFEAQASSANVSLIARATTRPVGANAAAILTVLTNLVSNSIKYRNTRLVKSKCFVYSLEAKGAAQIIVSDNGIGIHQSDRAQVLTQGYRASNGLDAADGQGLGLFQVSHLLSKIEGATIEIRRKNGGGTRFVITIPLLPTSISKASS